MVAVEVYGRERGCVNVGGRDGEDEDELVGVGHEDDTSEMTVLILEEGTSHL